MIQFLENHNINKKETNPDNLTLAFNISEGLNELNTNILYMEVLDNILYSINPDFDKQLINNNLVNNETINYGIESLNMVMYMLGATNIIGCGLLDDQESVSESKLSIIGKIRKALGTVSKKIIDTILKILNNLSTYLFVPKNKEEAIRYYAKKIESMTEDSNKKPSCKEENKEGIKRLKEHLIYSLEVYFKLNTLKNIDDFIELTKYYTDSTILLDLKSSHKELKKAAEIVAKELTNNSNIEKTINALKNLINNFKLPEEKNRTKKQIAKRFEEKVLENTDIDGSTLYNLKSDYDYDILFLGTRGQKDNMVDVIFYVLYKKKDLNELYNAIKSNKMLHAKDINRLLGSLELTLRIPKPKKEELINKIEVMSSKELNKMADIVEEYNEIIKNSTFSIKDNIVDLKNAINKVTNEISRDPKREVVIDVFFVIETYLDSYIKFVSIGFKNWVTDVTKLYVGKINSYIDVIKGCVENIPTELLKDK